MRLFLATSCMLAIGALSLSGAGALSGRRAPGFTLPDVKGQFHDLADYRGKVVLLDLMQTSCPHCQQLTPVLEQVKTKYGDRVVVLSVVLPPDTPKAAVDYIAKFQMSGAILFDCGQMTASYVKPDPRRPQVHFPHLFVIDPAGMIRNDFPHEEAGGLTPARVSAEVDRLLKR